tara:strand:+ start:190 stop:717 length:528 start_codon:yes stop_codon:yes gene_type:complete
MAGLDLLNWINNKIKGTGGDTFKEDLAISESSGNYDAVNEQGYMGKYQFGDARLKDFLIANEGYDKDLDKDKKIISTFKNNFMDTPSLQEDVMTWHVDDINSYIDSRELDKYIGKKIGGVIITREGLIAGAHLGGRTGLMRFLNGGMKIHGEHDKHDGSEKEPGTYISEYIMKFS